MDTEQAVPEPKQAPRAGSGGIVPPVETRFRKGQSGNPKGRQRKVASLSAVTEKARSLGSEMLDELVTVAKLSCDPDWISAKVKAIEAILDRGYGKPKALESLELVPTEELEAELTRRNSAALEEQMAALSTEEAERLAKGGDA